MSLENHIKINNIGFLISCMFMQKLAARTNNNNNNNNNNLFGKFTPKWQVMALGNALINCLNYL